MRVPSKNRLPVKRPPPQRKLSFTEAQMRYYGAADVFNPMLKVKKKLKDSHLIDFMKEVDRFPVPEALVGRTANKPFRLELDSVMNAEYRLEAVEAWGDYRPAIDAPNNSMESEEEFYVEESQSSEDENAAISHVQLKKDPALVEKQFDTRILNTSGFRLESMKIFPYRSREGEIPLGVLKVKKV